MKYECKLEKKNGFITKYGTTMRNDNPSVFYLAGKAKIKPTTKKEDYTDEIEEIRKEFSYEVRNVIMNHSFFNDNYIFNFDVSTTKLKPNKTSYVKYDVFLKPIIANNFEGNKGIFYKLSLNLDDKLISLLKKHKLSIN